MFKKYMDLAKINKIIAKQRKLAQSSPDGAGYTAPISAMLENEALGTFKNYPEYTRKVVNNFFVECVTKLRQSEAYRTSYHFDENDPLDSNTNAIFCAVVTQAVICKDITLDDAKAYEEDPKNGIKVLVNMKLLPERCLNDCEFDMRVA